VSVVSVWAYNCLLFLLSRCHLKIKFASCIVKPHLTASILRLLRFEDFDIFRPSLLLPGAGFSDACWCILRPLLFSSLFPVPVKRQCIHTILVFVCLLSFVKINSDLFNLLCVWISLLFLSSFFCSSEVAVYSDHHYFLLPAGWKHESAGHHSCWNQYHHRSKVFTCLLPVSVWSVCSVSLVGAATSIIFVTTNVFVFVMTKYFCHDKTFVVTNICRDKPMFVVTKVLSQQAYFCRNTSLLLLRQTHVCCDKSKLVATKPLLWQNYVDRLLSWQKYVCHDKHFCCDKRRVLSWQTCLSQQKSHLWQLSPMIVLLFSSPQPPHPHPTPKFFLLLFFNMPNIPLNFQHFNASSMLFFLWM